MTKEPDNPPPAETLPGAEFQPADRLVISTAEQLRAISDPLRLSILEMFHHEALTVKQIASRLGQTPTKLYYHVAELEKAGFVTLVDTRVKSGIIEKYYRITAEHITIDYKLLNAAEDQNNSLQDILSMIFDTTAREISRSIAAGAVNIQEVTSGNNARILLMRSLFNIRRKDLPGFMEKFTALLNELETEDNQAGPDSINYGCTIAFYPRITPESQNQD